MLYEQSKMKFSEEMFKNPGKCYRDAPFWSWNTLITKEMIEEQIDLFKQMGVGGFHVHVRVGLRNQYLGDEFLNLVKFCNEKAKEKGMLCWLYDEDRYSSGIAGGEVTKKVSFRARWLKLSPHKNEEMFMSFDEFSEKQKKNQKIKGCLLKTYDVVLESGYLKSVSAIETEEMARGMKWYLYLEVAAETPWCNNQTYVDALKTGAIKSFIDITHNRYAKELRDDFGKSIPAIFTDEPHISGLRLPDKADDMGDIMLPYTETLPEVYEEISGMDFWNAVPYIVWNRKKEEVSIKRYSYYETLSRMFTEAYCKQIGDWCEKHNLISTGHLLSEESLQGQTGAVGEAMRCYREFQIPGIDNLCDFREFSTVKQAASVAHQCGREGVLSELYGVTQWDFNFEGYKLAGDWQAALGVTVRVPHLSWASMSGEAKRDYPAVIGWQSPWYKDYSYLANYFARINYCLTRGTPVVRVGVLHPVESCWLLQGPREETDDRKRQLEEDFQNITSWLLTGGIDFDYIAESSLVEENHLYETNLFHCGAMGYQVVVVPSCINFRKTTLQKLVNFSNAGGTVIFAGDAPEYVDCRKNNALKQLINKCERIRLTRQALLEKLDAWREIDLRENDGTRVKNLLYQLREEDDCRWLFIAQAYKGLESRQDSTWHRRALHDPQMLEIRIKGSWQVEKYDTLTGEICCLEAEYREGNTVINYELYGDDSLLLCLKMMQKTNLLCKEKKELTVRMEPAETKYNLPEPVDYRMSEPNVLVLDYFEYALDGEPYHKAEEILRLDNKIRKRLGFQLRCESLAQPYVRVRKETREHKVCLRTRFNSKIELTGCYLALEEAEHCTCTLNGKSVDMKAKGYYVDRAIAKVELPKIVKGENELCIRMDYGDCTNLERMYVLGEFGVELRGKNTFLYSKPDKLHKAGLSLLYRKHDIYSKFSERECG